MNETLVWSCEAGHKFLIDAVDEFCRVHWAEPRYRSSVAHDGTFCVVDGRSKYRCRLNAAVRPERYEVYALEATP